jgi:hypothetical protein
MLLFSDCMPEGVMPPKFPSDPNQTSRHKLALSGTPKMSKKGQFRTYMPH